MPIGTLPAAAKKIWESVFQSSKKDGDSEKVAAQKAWSAVKQGWRKGQDGKWVKKSELAEFSMYITKSTLKNGAMTWAAVNSDTEKDSYDERMSLSLYKDFIGRINQGDSIPEQFKSSVCSEYWCGGMPYLSVSHYPDLNGQAVPGKPLEIYVDGNQLKAKGILNDNPLGHAVWRSLKEDKNKKPEEKIRISIGFLDMAHSHGDKLFVRENLYSLCPDCLQGVGNKVYEKGILVHLALTRVPVNKRTEMVLEEKSEMAKKKLTRKDDAASIVGDELAEELDMKQKATAHRSDALIEMSETKEETAELVAGVETADEPEEEDAGDDTAPEPVDEPAVEPVVAASEAVVEKFEDDTMGAVAKETPAYVDNLPYGGAVTMADAEKYLEAKNEAIYVMDMWSVFSNVAWNILERSDISNKKDAMVNAIDGFKNVLTAKAMVAFGVTEKSEAHPLQPAVDVLLAAVDGSIEKSDTEKAEVLNPILQDLGNAIQDFMAKSDIEQPVPENEENKNIIDEIKNLVQPLAESVSLLREEVGVLKSQANAKSVEPKNRIPQPRTAVVPPSLLPQKSEAQNSSTTPKLRDIINKSLEYKLISR